MAERTLAEAVAEIRLSDRQLTTDLANLRQRLLTAAKQIEKDVQVSVNFKLDDRKVTTEVAKLKQTISTSQPVITPTVDPGAEARIKTRLDNLKASIGLTVDPTPAVATGNQVARRLSTLRAQLGLDADPSAAIAAVDQVGHHVEEELPTHFDKAGTASGSRFGQSMLRSFRGITATVGIAAGGFIASALVTGFERLTTIEDATASLTVQLGDAAKAATLLNEVLNVVRGTPFNLDQFARAAANMVSFGVAAEKIPTFLRAIGEASASQGSRANEVAQRLSIIFGQITTANRINGQDLLQFSEAGVNALTILGNHFGKTTEEIRTMISNGVVPAKQALDVLAKGILEGTTGIAGTTVAFAGTMAKLRQTLSGSLGGFKASVARFGVELIQPFKTGLVAAFNGATEAVDSLAKRANDAFGGISRSEFGKQLVATLTDLPGLLDRVVAGFDKLGPAIAPIAAIVGASGLGRLSSILGPTLGGLIPTINPVVAAVGALVAFTPQLRDEFLPIFVELAKIVGEFGAVAGVALGKVSEALVPLADRLLKAFGQLMPVVQAAVGFGEGLLAVVVPAIEVLSAVIDKIPVPVITALVAAFLGFKLVTTEFTLLSRVAGVFAQGFRLTGSGLEKSATQASNAMGKMGLVVGGAFSGMALASKDASQQIVGAIGAIGSVAVGFATQGPWGGAAAAFGVALGVIVGHFTEAAREAAALKKEIDSMASSFSDATLEILKSRDALIEFNKSGLVNLQNLVGKSILDNKEFGTSLKAALAGLDLPTSGTAGAQEILRLFRELAAADGDITKVPQLLNSVNAAFDAQAPVIDRVIKRYGGVQEALDAIAGAQAQAAVNKSTATPIPIDPDLLALIKGEHLDTGEAALKQVQALLDARSKLGGDANLAKIAREQLDTNIAQDEGFRIAVRMAEAQLKLDHTTGSLNDNLAIEARALKEIETNTRGIVNAQVRDALAAAGASAEEVQANTQAAKQLGVNVEDTAFAVETLGRTGVDAFHKMREAAKDTAAAVGDLPPEITAAEVAAKNLATAIALSKAATDEVTKEVDKLHQHLADTSAATTLLEAVNKIKAASTNIVNEKDLAERAKAEQDLADTRDKILQLQADVADENAKAAIHIQDLQAQRARAVALGATRGVEAIDFDIAHVMDKVHQKEGDLADAEAKANETAAKIAALPAAALLEMQQLIDQANFTHVSLLDLIVSGATPAAATFQDNLTSFFNQQIDEFVKAAKADPSNALKIADTFTANVRDALLAGSIDPATAAALVSKYFDLTGAAVDIQKAAQATEGEYRNALRKSFVDDPELGKLAKNVNLLPTSDEAAVQAALSRDALQAEFDKKNIEAGVAVRPLTDADIKLLQGFTVDAVAQLSSVAMQVANATMTTQTLNVTVLGGVNNLDQRVVSGQIIGALGARGPGGVPLAQREGGVFTGQQVAQIVSAGMYRVFAEPETHGEGYVPLSPHKRTRSLGIMSEIADLFGYQLEPKDAPMAMPSAFAGGGGIGAPAVDADAIGRAVARHTSVAAARQLADRYDRAVHVAPGAIVIQGDRGPKRTAMRLVSELAELALKRR